MADVTDAKVGLLTLFSTTGPYWLETAIANLPANTTLTSSKPDAAIANPQVVVGDLTQTSAEWLSGKEQLFKADVDIHVYVRSVSTPPHTPMGTLKKQRTALINNVRTILVKHSDRPVTDIMFIFTKGRARDLDNITSREIVLHTVQSAEVWYTEIYS